MQDKSFVVRVTSCVGVALLILLSNSSAAPAVRSDVDAWNFLRMYGYVPESLEVRNQLYGKESFSWYLRDMQRFAGIEETGELDSETIRMMNTPRCGMADITPSSRLTKGIQNRYSYVGSPWPKKDLTYGFKSFSKKMPIETQREVFINATNQWAKYAPLSFSEVNWQTADTKVQFATGEHGDRDPFDGPNNVLAHATAPGKGNLMCFDDDENFSTSRIENTIYLPHVVMHEYGHALGLGHSTVKNSIMHPYYNTEDKPTDDDIQGIQSLYGVTGGPASGQPTQATPGASGEVCQNPSIDAIEFIDGTIYAFRGDQYYEMKWGGSSMSLVGPKSVKSRWPEISGKIDETLMLKDSSLYFFQGDKYWVYDKANKLKSGYPKMISSGFPGIPNNLDAALYIGDYVYFVKDNKCYKYSIDSSSLQAGYPKCVKRQWTGIPEGITAAFLFQGYAYLFTPTNYYRLDKTYARVENGNGGNTAAVWFTCSS